MEDSEYILHINFEEIRKESDKLQEDGELKDAIATFLRLLKETADRVEPTLSRETNDERELWEDYKQLQREKLAVLDLSHEWDYTSQTVKELNPKLDSLVRDAIEEMREHIAVLAESHRAHIDILEIYNNRKIGFLALIITGVISYLALWEFFGRDLLVSIRFPLGLSPDINYLLGGITLLPVFIAVLYAWIRRKTYF